MSERNSKTAVLDIVNATTAEEASQALVSLFLRYVSIILFTNINIIISVGTNFYRI